jgi:hypothetical protein
MAAVVQPLITTSFSAGLHAHFNGCDMYKDGRIVPNITKQPLFKQAVKYLVERPGHVDTRNSFNYSHATLTTLENQVLSQGLPAEKISILHVPGVGLFPDNYVNAIHDSGYTPSSLSRDIRSCLLPISTGDPGTRTKYPIAKIITWPDRVINLSPIGYEGITVGYNFDNYNKQVQIIITIQNNVPNSDGQPIVITSSRSYTTFEQINGGIDYLRAGNTVKNTAILAEVAKVARGTPRQIANAIIEIMKYLIGKALGDTLQAIELHIAIENALQIDIDNSTITNQNTCGFTTDGVLTSRYKSVNCSACLQIGQESGLREVLLYRAGTPAEMLEQIKLNYINNAIKHNKNVIFVIQTSYATQEINVSGTTISNRSGSLIRNQLDLIIQHISVFNAILTLITTNILSPRIFAATADDIRELSAICMANHVFKAGTNRIINIKELFDDLSAFTEKIRTLGLEQELQQVLTANNTPIITIDLRTLLDFTGSFVTYIYSLRGQMSGGGKDSKEKKKAFKSEINKISIKPIKRRIDAKEKKEQMEIMAEAAERRKKANSFYSQPAVTQEDVLVAMKYYHRKKELLKKAQDKEILFEDSYGLLVLIIYSIIKNCQTDNNFKTAFTTSLSQRIRYIVGDPTEEIVTEIISSEFIEPIYYILYRRFYYSGFGYFDFEYISKIVYFYITDEAGFLTITSLSIKVGPESKNVTHIVRKIVGRAFDEINSLTNDDDSINMIFVILKNMALKVVQIFPEISLTERDFIDPSSVTSSFSPQYDYDHTSYNEVPEEEYPPEEWFGGRAKTLNKKNIRNKRTRKGKHHRKTYKKK